MFETILYSIITSSIVVGLFTYFIKKYFDHMLKIKETNLNTILSVNQKKHEAAVNAFTDIWSTLIEIDRKIRHVMPLKINDAAQSGVTSLTFTEEQQYLLDCKYLIDKKSIFLNEKLYYGVSNHLKSILLPAYNGYIRIVNQAIAGEKTLDEVNNYYEFTFGEIYKKSNENLRSSFHKELKNIALEEWS